MSGYALGIDLGTTFTSAAVFQDDRAVAIPLADDQLAVPSAVYLTAEGQVAVGPRALEMAEQDPVGLVRHVKRRLGSSQPYILRGARYEPEQLVAVLLRWVIAEVERTLGEPARHVTLTHPANWLEHRQARLRDAAGLLGLDKIGTQSEPDAAAVYHAGLTTIPTGANLAVYDLGGGTFDASVIRKTATGLELAGEPSGIDNLGGIDFDVMLREHVMSQIGPLSVELDETDPALAGSMRRIEDAVVAAKLRLSSEPSASVPIDLPSGVTEIPVTRSEFEELVRPSLERTVDELAEALRQASVEPADVHAVLLVGGSSRIPLVSELITARLACPVVASDNPKIAVCLGAAITAGAVARNAAGPSPEPPADEEPPSPPPEPPVTRRAQGTLHQSGSPPTRTWPPDPDADDRAVAVSVDLDRQGLGGAEDTPIGAPIVPAVERFPRLDLVAGGSGSEEPDPVVIDPGGTDNRPILIVAMIVVIVIVVLLLLALL